MQAKDAWRGLLVLTLFCNVLSAEVHELAGYGGESGAAEGESQPSVEEQAHGALEEHAMNVYEALEAGYHNELSKEVIGEMKQTIPNWDHDELAHLGDLSKKERDAFHYIKSLKRDYEKLTGKKIEAGEFTPGEQGPDADTAMLFHDLQTLSAEMYGGADKVPKTKDVMVVNSHEDFIKELEKMQEENKYAFGGIPPPTHPGGGAIETAPGASEQGNLPTMEENARQMAVKDATQRDSTKTDKYESAKYEAEEAQELNTEAAEADMPLAEVSLLQISAEPEAESKDTPKPDAKKAPDAKAEEAKPKDAKAEEAKPKDAKAEEAKPKDAKAEEAKPKEAKTEVKAEGAPKEGAFDKTHARLNELEAVVKQHKNNLGHHLAKAQSALNEAEQRENAAALAAQAAEDKAVKDSYEGSAEEVVCDDPNDMACLRKRLAALALKTTKAKHTAYDLGRKSTEVAMLDSSTKMQKELADHAAEQESVYAAFVASQEDRVRQQIVRLAQANTKKEVAQKTAIKKALEAKRLASGRITDPTRIPISFDEMGQPHAHMSPAKAKKPASESLVETLVTDEKPTSAEKKPSSAEKKPSSAEKKPEEPAAEVAAEDEAPAPEAKKKEEPKVQAGAGVVAVKPEAVKADKAEDAKAEVPKPAAY